MNTDLHEQAISAEGLRKHFPGRGPALDGLDLVVARGAVHGLLGPNGAGKTTTVKILSTLLRLDAGWARVAGVDVAGDPAGVRARIGVAGQYAAVDPVLSGRQNLEMFARLHHLRARPARRRAGELLERFDLEAAADRPVRGYSGGMRRRLDLAISLIRSPHVLFLDEPTTGLDPRSRGAVWDAIRELADAGTTVLLTTQYLEEADQLSSRISLVDRGRVVAEGSPADLKGRIGGGRLEIAVPESHDVVAAAAVLGARLGASPETDLGTRRVSVPLGDGPDAFAHLAHALGEVELDSGAVSIRRPSLDDVFVELTAEPSTRGARR